ncbi:MAG: hypothetical protein ACRDX8_11495, partial [Acidimicrobiales bacterium]
VAVWVVASIVGDILWYIFAAAHVPPGDMSTSATGTQFDFNVLFYIGLPVMVGVWAYLGYAVYMWRESKPGAPDPVVGPTARHNLPLQVVWMVVTTVMILGLFVFGTWELIVPAGAGGGEGPNPVWKPASKNILPIQVIGQQWVWTYRYPTFGGMESTKLVIPDNTTIAFHVTSLDVIHDFWAYQIGIKADANPNLDNVAYTTTTQLGTFTVRCDELCGIWHGAMYNYGKVETQSQFMHWATTSERASADNTKLLPPFAWTYTPSANGATGVYYNTSTHGPFSKIEKYGATPNKVKVTSPTTITLTT